MWLTSPLSARRTTMTNNASGHFADFFADDQEMVAAAAEFLHEGFAADQSCIAVFTHDHWAQIKAQLREHGWHAQQLIDEYRFVVLGAHETLASMWIEDRLDVRQFYQRFGELIRLMAAGGKEVRIVGEMVGLLAQFGRLDAVVQLEELANDLSREHSFRMYCMYCESAFKKQLDAACRRRVCAMHSGSLRVA
jgi:hypothetical protein